MSMYGLWLHDHNLMSFPAGINTVCVCVCACVFMCVCVCVCVCARAPVCTCMHIDAHKLSTLNHHQPLPLLLYSLPFTSTKRPSSDLSDHRLHHRGDRLPAGGVRRLRQHHEGQPHQPTARGGLTHHAAAGHLRHRLLHQLRHHHGAQPHVREGGHLDHRHG